MDREAVAKALQELRERRALIPAMRDYRPQRSKSKEQPAADLGLALGKFGKFVGAELDDPQQGEEVK